MRKMERGSPAVLLVSGFFVIDALLGWQLVHRVWLWDGEEILWGNVAYVVASLVVCALLFAWAGRLHREEYGKSVRAALLWGILLCVVVNLVQVGLRLATDYSADFTLLDFLLACAAWLAVIDRLFRGPGRRTFEKKGRPARKRWLALFWGISGGLVLLFVLIYFGLGYIGRGNAQTVPINELINDLSFTDMISTFDRTALYYDRMSWLFGTLLAIFWALMYLRLPQKKYLPPPAETEDESDEDG